MENPAALSDDGHAFQRHLTRGIAGFLVLAVVLRLVRAIQNYPMWCDETMFAANLLDRDWSELARPLDYRQVCPLGFLALEWIAVRMLGFSELAAADSSRCSAVWRACRFLSAGATGARPRDGRDIPGRRGLRGFRAAGPLCRRGQAV